MRKENNFVEKTKRLLNAIEAEIRDDNSSEEECNSYVDQLDDLKGEISDEEDWINSYPDINKVGGFFNDATKKEIKDKLIEMRSQLLKIYRRLGGDLEETKKKDNSPNSPVINVFQSQSQSQYQTTNIQIEELKKELEEELNKKTPNKSRIKRILDDIIDVAKNSAGSIIAETIMRIFD